ncbi:hypothetical protein [uncultured Gammaproteobacteria bacterium]|nr:hypothetical protein [uncultured Gammaproteobacteria bacterium]
MNNHQNAIFHQLDNFMKHSHSFAMTIFHKITKSAKLVILLIIPIYAKVSIRLSLCPRSLNHYKCCTYDVNSSLFIVTVSIVRAAVVFG